MKKRKRGAQPENQNASKKPGEYVKKEKRFSQRLDPELCRRIDEYKQEHNMTEKEFLLYAFSLVLGDV